jgi:hypothetical protein
MVFVLTPRTEEAPPGPGSQILPTPGQTPLRATLDDTVRLADVADVAAAAVVDESAMYVPPTIKVAIASSSAGFPSFPSRLENILIPSPCDRKMQPSPTAAQARRRRMKMQDKSNTY